MIDQEVERKPVRKPRPDAFLAIQIDNPAIVQRVVEFQRRLIEAVPSARRHLEPVSKMHLTLCVTSIENSANEDLPAEVLREAHRSCIPEAFTDSFESASLRVQGIGQFDGCRVIYAKVTSESIRLKTLNSGFTEILEKMSCPMFNHDAYRAHMTLFKVRHRFNELDKLRMAFDKLASEELDFGEQPVGAIQFLHMYHPKDAKGYYHKLAEIRLGEERLSLTEAEGDVLEKRKQEVRKQVREKMAQQGEGAAARSENVDKTTETSGAKSGEKICEGG